MIDVKKSHQVGYPIEKVFHVVKDVAQYQTFIPWCLKSIILEEAPSHENEFYADLTVGAGPFQETYRSYVMCSPFYSIQVRCSEKPLKHLETMWTFKEISKNKTEVMFEIKLSLSSKLLQSMVRKVFEKSAEKIFLAFESRLKQLYG